LDGPVHPEFNQAFIPLTNPQPTPTPWVETDFGWQSQVYPTVYSYTSHVNPSQTISFIIGLQVNPDDETASPPVDSYFCSQLDIFQEVRYLSNLQWEYR
jgi:hypothetical protein